MRSQRAEGFRRALPASAEALPDGVPSATLGFLEAGGLGRGHPEEKNGEALKGIEGGGVKLTGLSPKNVLDLVRLRARQVR